MSNSDHPTGIIETMLESIEENNRRLDTLESKIDRIWEIVSKLASPVNINSEPISNKQPPLFDDVDGTTVEKDEQEFQPIEDSRLEPEEIASPPEIEFADEVLEEATEQEAEGILNKEDDLDTPLIPDWQDKESYREYTSDLIFKLKNAGMTLKEMAEELNGMGLKSRSGKDSWSFGMVNSVLQQGEKG